MLVASYASPLLLTYCLNVMMYKCVANISCRHYTLSYIFFWHSDFYLPIFTHYLPIAGGRIIGFLPFPRVLVLCEMQSVSSRIWTCVAVSIPYDNNHYTTGTSLFFTISSFTCHYIIINILISLWLNNKRNIN